VDLYQLHSPTIEDVEQYDCVETLDRFKRDGKIKEYGISVRSPMDGSIAIERYGFKIVQVNYNLIDHRAEECGLFDSAVAHGAGIVCRTPICFGFLSGKLNSEIYFTKDDHRANWPKDQLDRWANAPALFASIVKDRDQSYTQMALQFCLAQKAISTVIPGMMNSNELEEDLAAADLPPLNPEELDEIERIYSRNIFFNATAKSRGKR
jgi:aryl-alcohol dehydrogenase-like predicted oxidoreductase